MAMTFLPNSKVNGYKIIGKPLNKGANANSYKAQSASGESVFLKQYKSPSVKVEWYRKYLEYQKEMKRRIESSPVAANQTYRFLDFFEHAEAPGLFCYCQAFEFASGGRDLAEHLKDPEITWHQRITFAKLLMVGIKTLHSLKIVHSDLKPENLYLIPDSEIKTGYRFKVIDFDVSLLDDVKAPWDGFQGYAGTPGYLSPEHLKGEIPTEASDVFTCGIILAELLCRGGNPFSQDDEKYKEEVLGYKLKPLRLLESTGDAAYDTLIEESIFNSLHPDPRRRGSAEELHKALISNTGTVRPGKLSPALRLVLTGENGEQLKFNITADVGKTLLNRFGDDAKFASGIQFVLSKEEDGWKLCPSGDAQNATIINNRQLTEAVYLNFDDEISVGNLSKNVFKLRMKVSGERK